MTWAKHKLLYIVFRPLVSDQCIKETVQLALTHSDGWYLPVAPLHLIIIRLRPCVTSVHPPSPPLALFYARKPLFGHCEYASTVSVRPSTPHAASASTHGIHYCKSIYLNRETRHSGLEHVVATQHKNINMQRRLLFACMTWFTAINAMNHMFGGENSGKIRPLAPKSCRAKLWHPPFLLLPGGLCILP